MSVYTTKSQIEDYLGIEISEELDARVGVWIKQVSKYIDNYTGREFGSEKLLKKYDGNDDCYIDIDDIETIDKLWFVTYDSTADAGTREIPNSYFYLYQNDDPNKKPYNKIVLNGRNAFYFPEGNQNIWVLGDFGYESVPEDLQLACTKLVASFMKTGIDGGNIVNTFTEGDLSISYGSFDKALSRDISTQLVLDYYKRKHKIESIKIKKR